MTVPNKGTVASDDCSVHFSTLPNIEDCSNNIPPINVMSTSTITHDDVTVSTKQTDPVIPHNKSELNSPIIHKDVITSEDLLVTSPITLSVHSDHEPLGDKESTQ